MSFEAEAAKQIVRGLEWVKTSDGLFHAGHAGRALKWRHHGLGMLQAEFSEALRVHVWHPALVSPGMAWPRCVHDHRFDIASAVVVGAVRDVVPDLRPYTVEPHPSGRWTEAKMYEIEHAKEQDRLVSREGCSTATSAKLLPGRFALTRLYADEARAAGTSYRIPRRIFHTTEVDALAVTVVHRSNFDDKLARVLCAPGEDVLAVSGIVRDDSPEHRELVASVLREAAAAARALG